MAAIKPHKDGFGITPKQLATIKVYGSFDLSAPLLSKGIVIVGIAIIVILMIAFAGIKKRRNQQRLQFQLAETDDLLDDNDSKRDDIIAVRKIAATSPYRYQEDALATNNEEPLTEKSFRQAATSRQQPTINAKQAYQAAQSNTMIVDDEIPARSMHHQMAVDDDMSAEFDDSEDIDSNVQPDIIVINVFARPGKQFFGYDLLQSLLSAGMRYGDMAIFHRHQDKSGHGPIIFSLASATEPGTFDIHKMGGFSSTGLSLFLQLANNETDFKHFNLMLEAAKQLADDLDGGLFDMYRQPLTDAMVHQYRQRLS